MTDFVRDSIIAKLNTIPDIGQVHSYQRYAARTKNMADLYSYTPAGATVAQLRGWFVRRVKVVDKFGPGWMVTEDTQWLIRGYLAVEDSGASEKVFDGLIDQVRGAFRIYAELEDTQLTAGAFTTRVENQSGASLEDSAPVLFCDVLCHSAKISLITRQRRIDPQT
jgi:hypothetical protein